MKINVPTEILLWIEDTAKRTGTSRNEVIRRVFRLGMIGYSIRPGERLLIEDANGTREITMSEEVE